MQQLIGIDRLNEKGMFQFRITKYDPVLRGPDGAYLPDDWTAVSDIGQLFDGVLLTRAEYERVELAYVASALAFLRESGIETVTVRGLENKRGAAVSFADGDIVSLQQAEAIIPRVLREQFWCKLEGVDSFVHIGWDYYMYVGVPTVSGDAHALAASSGLFVEAFRSPCGAPGA